MTARPRQGISQGAVVEAAELRLRRPRQHPEADFQRRVVRLARSHGWRCHFIPDWMYQAGMLALRSKPRGDREWPDPGFVDLALARKGPDGIMQVLFVELKSDVGQLSAVQAEWRDLLSQTSTWLIWRPKDWKSIERWLA